MTIEYDIAGPIEVFTADNGLFDNKQEGFWERVKSYREGLAFARGVYVFGISSSGSSRIKPWYIGKAQNQSYKSEIFQPHKLNIYNNTTANYSRYRSHFFFVPRTTSAGFFSEEKNAKDIDFLEKMMIAYGIEANPRLLNVQHTKYLKELIVPGVINTPRGGPTSAQQSFKEAFWGN